MFYKCNLSLQKSDSFHGLPQANGQKNPLNPSIRRLLDADKGKGFLPLAPPTAGFLCASF
jgi:hypothetical protein